MNILRKTVKVLFYIFLLFCIVVFTLLIALKLSTSGEYRINKGEELKLNTVLPVKAVFNGKKAPEDNKFSVDLKMFGVIPYSTVSVEVVDSMQVAVLGQPFGMKIYTEGVLVVDETSIKTKNGNLNPAINAGIRIGDYILSVNGTNISSNEDISEIVKKSNGKKLDFTVLREKTKMHINVKPVLNSETGEYNVGIWVRDSSAGVGTLTFYSPSNRIICGLGHGITDSDTDKLLSVNSGEMVCADIISVQKGKEGTPGELKGRLESETIGEILYNCEMGVYGKLTNGINCENLTEVALKQDIQDGKAQILCTVNGEKPKLYSCNVKINRGILNAKSDMTVTVTDGNLLEETGGIVQGMSGSPVIQNGKLIGAITHVLVDDPTTGYAIFAENMLETAQNVASENKLKDVS